LEGALKAVNDLVVQAAVALGLEDGAKLRVDTTVVETDIHHPTDNTLLWDVVTASTTPARCATCREPRTILAPAAASPNAMARPSPRLAPDTTATLPDRKRRCPLCRAGIRSCGSCAMALS
jgi:hypothetical protein